MEKTPAQKQWQIFVTLAVIALVAFNFYLLLTERQPFAWSLQVQAEYLGSIYVGLLILTFILLLAVELIPFFLLKWLIEKKTGTSLT